MQRRVRQGLQGFGIWMLVGFPAAGAFAHHSFAPHFDPDDTLSITGVITEFEPRNPHVYLHIEGTEEGGRATGVCVRIRRHFLIGTQRADPRHVRRGSQRSH